MKKTILYIAAAVLLIGGGATIISKNKKETDRQSAIIASTATVIPVDVAVADFEHLSDDYVANGTFAPLQQMMLSAEMPGKITRVLVKEGDFVRAGQTVATIKKDVMEVDRSTAMANYQNAVTDNQRFENAFKTGGVTQQQLDMSRLQLKNAKNQLEQANIRIGDSNVKTLISGYINSRMVEPGAVVAPGSPLFEIVNVAQLKLQVSVDEGQVARLRIGQPVEVKVSVLPEDQFVGKITFIAPLADASLNFPVEIMVSNPASGPLRAGMYGTAIFSSGEKGEEHAYLVVPKEAFVNGVSSNQIFVVQPDETVKLVQVVSGRVFGDKVEVVSGLQKGDRVVVSGQINLSDGTRISVTK